MGVDNSYKEALLNTGLFKRVTSSPYQYRCQYCPFCGDGKWHLYVLIKTIDDTPVLYNCKKCNASGIVNKTFLEYFNLDESIRLPKNIRHKRLEVSDNVQTNIKGVFVNEQDDVYVACQYIEKRVGVYPTIGELQSFQYIHNPMEYAREYLSYHGNNRKYFDGKVWFKLTNGNIIGRNIEDVSEYRWLRFKSSNVIGMGLYTIKLPIDMYKPINVCITEGIMDAIGLYYHRKIDNAVYVCVMGSDYLKGLQHVLNLGIFGESVNVGIYKDSDVNTYKIYIPEGMKRMFKKIEVYQNMIGKDYGVCVDQMEINRICRIK